jgi:hypothetical protein
MFNLIKVLTLLIQLIPIEEEVIAFLRDLIQTKRSNDIQKTDSKVPTSPIKPLEKIAPSHTTPDTKTDALPDGPSIPSAISETDLINLHEIAKDGDSDK